MVDEGWVSNEIDLKSLINEIIENHPEYTYVVEESMLKTITNKKAKLVVVDSIMDSIDKLFDYSKKKSSARVIAITGSVGKTTAIGLIENIISRKYKTLRVYSKRITPINLKAYLINLLDDSYDYIVLEMSLFYHHHVDVLSSLLNPYVAAIINIDSCHI